MYKNTRFKAKVLGAHWDDQRAQWRIQIEDLGTSRRSAEHYDFVLTAIGHFNEWNLPDYPGINEYKGHLRHSSNWDPEFDPVGKRIATIGNGASGIQVTAELQKLAGHLDHYTRNKTWIAGSYVWLCYPGGN